MPLVGLKSVIVTFRGHTQLLFGLNIFDPNWFVHGMYSLSNIIRIRMEACSL